MLVLWLCLIAMTDYRRFHHPGATWFFTVNLVERHEKSLLVDRIDDLRAAFSYVKNRHPFEIDAVVILPDHLHCIWTLPETDTDFSTRWSLIKGYFSRHIDKGEAITESRRKRRERGIWQRRFWEHMIRNEDDYRRHVDYIHWNPVKHGHSVRVSDWPHSSFHQFVDRGFYTGDWGGGGIDLASEMVGE